MYAQYEMTMNYIKKLKKKVTPVYDQITLSQKNNLSCPIRASCIGCPAV